MYVHIKRNVSPEKLFGRFAIAVSMTLTFVGLVLVTFNYENLKKSAEKFQFASSDNVTWTIVQIEVDYNNLRLALLRGLLSSEQEKPIDLDDIKKAFDVYYSRVEAGRFIYGSAFGTNDSGPGVVLDHLNQEKNALAREIDDWITPTNKDLAEFLVRIDRDSENVRKFTTQALQVLVVEASDEREDHLEILNNYTTLLILVVGLLFALLAISFLLQKRLTSRATETLRVAENLQRVIEASQDAVIIADAAGRIIEYSKSAEDIFGFTASEALGAKMETIFIPEQLREAHRKGMKNYLETGSGKVVNKGRHVMRACDKNGREFPAEVTISASLDINNEKIFIGIIRDISDIIENEAKLQSALETARCEVLAKQRFLAVMTHEMRTPLQGVLASFDLLDDGLMNEEHVALVDLGKRSGVKALEQVNSMLELARLNEDVPVRLTEVINPASSLQNLVTLLDPLLLQKRNTISVNVEPHENIEVLGNQRLFNVIFENLLANANKFTSSGHISVKMQTHMRGDKLADLVISVEDSGIGIPEEHLQRIFDDFAVAHERAGDTHSGTGLGLSIVRNATKKMGGNIDVKSIVGVGSSFTFRCSFQIAKPKDVQIPLISTVQDAAHVETEPCKVKPRVLVVDDNEINQALIGIMLDRLGCHYECAYGGLQAVEKCRYNLFDLILMDLNMPEMNGLETTSAIKDLETKQGKIVCITAQSGKENLSAVLDVGMECLLTKPIRLGDLAKLLEQRVFVSSTEVAGGAVSDVVGADHTVNDAAAIEDLISTMGLEYTENMLDQFAESLRSALDSVSSYLQAGKNLEAAEALHSMAGSAGMLGGLALYQTLLDLEVEVLSHTVTNDDVTLLGCHDLLADFLKFARLVSQGMRCP